MSKSSKKIVVFSLTMLGSENPFATLEVPLKKFAALRADFEGLGLHVSVNGFHK